MKPIPKKLAEEKEKEQRLRAQWPKPHGCGRTYLSLEHFRRHTVFACNYEDAFATQEWRYCECGSTLAVLIQIHNLQEE